MEAHPGITAGESTSGAVGTAKVVGVIDVGTTSIRLALGQIDRSGRVRTLETLSQAVALGKDTFSDGAIRGSTIEQCVLVLKSCRDFLAQYGIADPRQVRVVATSAVREATNRSTFQKRIYVATGFRVDPIDESAVNRITYLGVHPLLSAMPQFADQHVLIAEVGGGSTEILLVKNGDVLHTHTYRMGSLRLRKMLETYGAPAVRARNIMEDHIKRIVEQVYDDLPRGVPLEMLALGGDVRFAATQIDADWARTGLARISITSLARLTDEVLNLSVDELVRKHHVTFPDAETLGPALLTYLQLANALELKYLFVSDANLRDGLLQEMAAPNEWSDEFCNQIIRSALDIGRRFGFDEAHGLHVAKMATSLFRALQDEHRLEPRHELLLYIAALLHDIGYAVSTRSHHKHSMYLIRHSDLFGLSQKELLTIALVARYHRRASPRSAHEGYVMLDWEDRINVSKMSALLRLADALDRSNRQRIRSVECFDKDDQLVITASSDDDVSLEQMAVQQKGSLFRELFGRRVILCKK